MLAVGIRPGTLESGLALDSGFIPEVGVLRLGCL